MEAATRHAAGRPVTAVRLRVGALRQVVPGSLDFCFSVVSDDTLCEGARLEQEPVAAALRCPACAAEWDPAPGPADDWAAVIPRPRFRCPRCGEGGAEVIRGEELEVESIEVLAEGAAATTNGPASAPGI